MGKNKGLPRQLKEKQELLRQQSVNKVLRALGELKAEGRSVTITALVEEYKEGGIGKGVCVTAREDIPSYAG